MTWDEFKKNVDDELAKLGKTGEIEVDYIDIDAGWCEGIGEIHVGVDEILGLQIL